MYRPLTHPQHVVAHNPELFGLDLVFVKRLCKQVVLRSLPGHLLSGLGGFQTGFLFASLGHLVIPLYALSNELAELFFVALVFAETPKFDVQLDQDEGIKSGVHDLEDVSENRVGA
jgi:hypothetical protein